MITLRNPSDKDRQLPSGLVIPAGGTADALQAFWARDKTDPKVAKWLAKGLLVEGPGEAEPVTEQTELDELDILIAKLAKHGITKTRRSSVESLRAALDKAESEAAE